MLFSFLQLRNYIPDGVYQTAYDINYSELYKHKKRLIIMDIDNTLIPYDLFEPTDKIIALVEKIKTLGFIIVFMSNNRKKRVFAFASKLDSPYIASAHKPFSRGYKKIKKMFPEITFKEMHVIGDQLMTDILGAKRMGITCDLVKVIKRKSEKWYTKVNRLLERFVLIRIKKHFPQKYHEIISLME